MTVMALWMRLLPRSMGAIALLATGLLASTLFVPSAAVAEVAEPGTATARPPLDSAGADELMEEGIQIFSQGDEMKGLELLHRAIEADPGTARRHFEFGYYAGLYGHRLAEAGEPKERTVPLFATSSEALVKALRLYGDDAAAAEDVSACYTLLGELSLRSCGNAAEAVELYELALQARPDNAEAARRLEAALAVRDGVVPPGIAASATGSPPSMAVDGSAVPADEDPALMDDGPDIPPVVRVANTDLVLAFDGSDHVKEIWEYVPANETMDRWTSLAAIRHYRTLLPVQGFVDVMTRDLKKRDANLISVDPGNGREATIAFVIHAPDQELSEINVWHYFVEGADLFSHQFARRFTGEAHREQSLAAAQSHAAEWLRELETGRLGVPGIAAASATPAVSRPPAP